jgi:hypothetical protein
MSPNTSPSTSDTRADSVNKSDTSPGTPTDRTPRVSVETSVPDGAASHRCAYCDRPFAAASYLALHRGLAHADRLSETEREAFETAYEEEQSELGRFRLIALGLLVLLYFGFLFTFAVVT